MWPSITVYDHDVYPRTFITHVTPGTVPMQVNN